MATGDNTANSIIWVPGETQGHDSSGIALVNSPTTGPASAAIAAAAATAATVTVSGGVPTGAPAAGHSNQYINSLTNKESFWDGHSWLTVSGA